MKWKYLSIDIETLGLNEDHCDMIEFAAVLDDLETPLEKLPTFHCYLTTEDNRYKGDIKAMVMNAGILKRIADREKGYLYMLGEYLDENVGFFFRQEHGYEKDEEFVVIGKNYAMFDKKFLDKVGFGIETKIHRRILDLGSMYWNPVTDKVPPNLNECLKRAGFDKKVNHTAVEDALDVIRCVRHLAQGAKK